MKIYVEKGGYEISRKIGCVKNSCNSIALYVFVVVASLAISGRFKKSNFKIFYNYGEGRATRKSKIMQYLGVSES